MSGNITLNPQFVDLLGGDHLAALMLSQIVYWYKPGKDGKAKITKFKDDNYWLAKSHKEWHDELRLTRFQSQRCLAKLKAKGLIETVVYRFNGSPTVHIRLVGVQGNRISNDWQPAMDCVETSNGLHADTQFLTETTTETTAETTTSGAACGLPGLTPLAEGGGEKGEKTLQGKTTPEGSYEKPARINKKSSSKEYAMATAAEILKKHAEKSKAVTPNTKAGLYYLWQKRMASLTGTYAKELTLKDKGQLGQFLAKAGDKASEALDYALNHWSKFTWEVRTKKNQSSAPEVPMPGYVLANYDILLQLIAQKELTMTQAPSAPPLKVDAPKPQPKPVESVDKPSKEQILADLEYFNNLNKG